MPKFKHRKTGRVIEAIFYDGTPRSFERVKAFFPHVEEWERHVDTKAYYPNPVDYKLKTTNVYYRVHGQCWLYLVGGRLISSLDPESFFEFYRSVRASTPLS